ncbi:MAG: hypothetical protein JNN20_11955 [Betaproteobacteria bacterium]|nr:hypothetical protein [Betaproteobacteria bacterium]
MNERLNVRYLCITLILAASMGAKVMAQSTPGGTIIGATTKDDVGGLAKNTTDVARELAAEKTKITKPVVVSRDDRFKLGLRAAQAAMKAGRHADALAALTELDSLPAKTADETFAIERNRVAVASLSGDEVLLVKSLEVVLNAGKLSAAESVEFSELLTRKYFNRKDFSKTIAWASRYAGYGGSDPAIRRALLMSYYFNNEFARAGDEVSADILAAEKVGARPTEEQLRLLVSCAQKLDNKVAYASAMEKYATYYPKTK